jgi:DNA-directed RNA polymerase II subunit RPB1
MIHTNINKDGVLEKTTDYVINTKGINFDVLFNINGLDLNRSIFNDINKIYELFGIEAARKVIIRELHGVMLNNDAEVNYQHISIYGDLMTNTGTLTSIDRHGLNKLDTDPFSRASFEKPVEQLMNAALFNEVDYMKSVSSRIMAGLCIKGGTGLCEVIMDRNMLENSEYTGTTVQKGFTKLDDTQTLVEQTTDVFIPDF